MNIFLKRLTEVIKLIIVYTIFIRNIIDTYIQRQTVDCSSIYFLKMRNLFLNISLQRELSYECANLIFINLNNKTEVALKKKNIKLCISLVLLFIGNKKKEVQRFYFYTVIKTTMERKKRVLNQNYTLLKITAS